MHHPAQRAHAVPFLLLILSFCAGLALAADPTLPRPMTHEDLWLMKRPGALAASPDGRWFVVAVGIAMICGGLVGWLLFLGVQGRGWLAGASPSTSTSAAVLPAR